MSKKVADVYRSQKVGEIHKKNGCATALAWIVGIVIVLGIIGALSNENKANATATETVQID